MVSMADDADDMADDGDDDNVFVVCCTHSNNMIVMPQMNLHHPTSFDFPILLPFFFCFEVANVLHVCVQIAG